MELFGSQWVGLVPRPWRMNTLYARYLEMSLEAGQTWGSYLQMFSKLERIQWVWEQLEAAVDFGPMVLAGMARHG